MGKVGISNLISKSIVLTSVFLLAIVHCLAQSNEYIENIRIADSLYKVRQFESSALHFSKAFESLGWKGSLDHRYRASKSWAMAKIPDSAFYNLFAISERLMFADIQSLHTEKDFHVLHRDSRWKNLTDIVGENAQKKVIFSVLKDSLEQMFQVDQQQRTELETIYKELGMESIAFKNKISEIKKIDSFHTIYISEVLDKYGYLGELEIGRPASTALYIMFLHGPLDSQLKYLPMLRQAFLEKKINPHNFSLLEDKINLTTNGYQIYGTQIGVDENGNNIVRPIRDKENVNERRKELGLEPLEDYLKRNGIENY